MKVANELFEQAKQELMRSNVDRKHPFRFFYLGTMALDRQGPAVRTVVKRGIDADLKLLCYTDARSPKMQQIVANPKVSVLFYHPRKQLQIRMKGNAQIIDEELDLYKKHLNIVQQSRSITDYTTDEAPGNILGPGQMNPLFSTTIHFALIRIKPLELDILQLNRDGHQRILCQCSERGWKIQAVIP